MSLVDAPKLLSVSFDPKSFMAQPMPKLVQGFSYKFPKLQIQGRDSPMKKKLIDDLLGVSELNFVLQTYHLSFIKLTKPDDDHFKIGFGGKTYKLKNVQTKIDAEVKDKKDSPMKKDAPIEIKLFSEKIERECTIIINDQDPNSTPTINTDDLTTSNYDTSYDSLLKKHTQSGTVVKSETKTETDDLESYDTYLKHFLEKAKSQDKKWIYDIISGETKEKILFSNEDVALIKDIKWEDTNLNNFHYLAVFKDKTLMSLRDLKQTHIPLLKRVKDICLSQLKLNFDLTKIDLDIYFHYHPSIWQLHLHFVSRTAIEKHKKYMFTEVTENLKTDSFYQSMCL